MSSKSSITVDETTIAAIVTAVIAQINGSEPAKASKPEKASKASDTPKANNFGYLRNALKAHKASGAIRAGITVKEAIAEGLMTPEGNLPDGTVPVVTDVPKAAPKAKAPAKRKVTKKQRKAARKLAQNAPRRANGTIAPKTEWAIRGVLAAQGLSPVEVDQRTAEAVALLG